MTHHPGKSIMPDVMRAMIDHPDIEIVEKVLDRVETGLGMTVINIDEQRMFDRGTIYAELSQPIPDDWINATRKRPLSHYATNMFAFRKRVAKTRQRNKAARKARRINR